MHRVIPEQDTSEPPQRASAAEVLMFAECCRSGRLGLELLDVGRRRTVNRDPARVFHRRNFVDQLDLQQAVVKRRAPDLDIVRQIKLTLERRDEMPW